MAIAGFLEKSPISGIKKRVLKNGITVFLEELPERKKVVFLVGVGAGSRNETAEISGISHLVEHIQFNSNRFRTKDEIVEDVEDGGADIDAGTYFDSTIFSVLGYSRYLSKNIRILYEMISNFEYKEEELQREKQEVLTEIKKAIDSPDDHYLANLFYPLILRKTPSERPILGTPKTVKQHTADSQITFKKRFYLPDNMVIFVCGKFNEERVIRVLEKTFGRLKLNHFSPPEFKIDLTNRHREYFKKKKALKLAYLALGYKVPGDNHPDSLKLMLLNSILSGGMSSRLWKRLRSEKGIGYDQLGSVHIDCGSFGIFYVKVGGFDHRRFKETKKIILEELEDLKNNLVSKREFLRAKNLLLSGNDDAMEDLKLRTEWLSDAYFTKSVFDSRNLKKYISKISRESIRRVAQKYFSDKYTLAALVPENFEI
ncbi:MAG: pitrilysin family protein [bacterium]|nr:pitrilysin family protein [bacterium]